MKFCSFKRILRGGICMALMLACIMGCLLPAAAASPSSTVTKNATLAYTLRNLPLGRAVQNFYVGETYIYITQRVDATTYLSRLRIEGKEAFYMDRMTLNNAGHGQSLDFYRYNDQEYFYVGCKADSVSADTETTYDWSLQIARLKYEPGKTYDYTELNRMSYMNYVGTSGSRLGTTYRVACAVNGGYTIFRVQTTESTVTYAAYNTDKLNALLDASKSVDMRNAKSICSFSFTQSGSNIIRPNGSFQGIDLSSKNSIYLSGGGEGDTPQIARINSSGSYLKLVKVGNVGTHEIEGVQTQRGRVYFLIVPSTDTTEKKNMQAIYYINESEFGITHTIEEYAGTEPTCTQTGLTAWAKCTTCGNSLEVRETIPALGHTAVSIPGVAPTCSQTGLTEGSYCSVCNQTIKAQEVIPTGDHTAIAIDAVAPTCTSTGLTEGSYCSVCNEVIREQEVVPAGDHTPVILDAVAPTCNETGLTEGSYCSVCNEVLVPQETVSALGHNLVTTEGYAPTCTADGLSDGVYCATCKETLTEQSVIPATGHTTEIIPGTPATCTASGKSDGEYCTVCKETIVEQTNIPRLGHNYLPVDNHDGTHSETCEHCNRVLSTTEHSYVDDTCVCGAINPVEAPTQVTMTIRHTLSLGNDISIRYGAVAAEVAAYDSFYLECSIPNYEGDTLLGYTTCQLQPDASNTFTLEGITAKMMNDEVKAVLCLSKDGKEYRSQIDTYSVATYAYNQLNKASASDGLKAVCANLLRYGAMAQNRFTYRTNALVSDAMTDAHNAYLTDLNSVTLNDNRERPNDLDNPAVSWKGVSLILGNKVILNYGVVLTNYSGSAENLCVRLSYIGSQNKTVTVDLPLVNAGSYYTATYEGLLAAEMRTIVTAAVYEGDTRVSTSYKYSVETYAARNTDDALKPLCAAMIAYGDSASSFFGG